MILPPCAQSNSFLFLFCPSSNIKIFWWRSMARFGFCFLIFLGILVLQTMADKSEAQNEHGVKPKGVEEEETPALSPMQAETESREAEAPEIRRLGKHHSSDKCVAGGGVIIGGLVTAIFAAVFCYIRVTRKRHGDLVVK